MHFEAGAQVSISLMYYMYILLRGYTDFDSKTSFLYLHVSYLNVVQLPNYCMFAGEAFGS